MNDIQQLIRNGAILKIEMTSEDLREFGQEIAKQVIETTRKELPSPKENDRFITADETCQILNISRVTLWNFDKRGLTNPIRIGNMKRYKLSEIQTLGQKEKT